jgi:hypothetical protein
MVSLSKSLSLSRLHRLKNGALRIRSMLTHSMSLQLYILSRLACRS